MEGTQSSKLFYSHNLEVMNYLSKAKFLGLVVVPIIATTSVLAACSTTTQNQAKAPSPTATDVGNPHHSDHSSMNHSNMNHGGMDHGMDLGPADAEYDLRFIDAMIPHHRGAIDMANEALQKSKRPEIKTLAQNIIQAQNREENELMRKWRKAWYPKAAETAVAYDSQQGKTVSMSAEQKDSMMMKLDLGAADAEFDLRFINAMIPHHEGAIVMAKDALAKSQRPEIKQLANDILTSQQAEIEQMKQWRKAWYNQ